MKICRGSCCISFVFCCTLVDTFHLFSSVRQLQKWSFSKTALIHTWWEVPIFKFPGQCWLGNTGGFAAEVCWVAFRNRLVSWRNINLRRDFLPNVYCLKMMVLAQSNNKINHAVINPLFGLSVFFCENRELSVNSFKQSKISQIKNWNSTVNKTSFKNKIFIEALKISAAALGPLLAE